MKILRSLGKAILSLFAPVQPFQPKSVAQLRLQSARSRGCTCSNIAEMDAWYGPACPVHRMWPQK